MPPIRLGSPPVARLLSLVALSATMGCALVQPPLTSPAHGGGTWRALTSRRFEVKTDLPRSDALEALRALEGSYDLFADVAYPDERVRAGRIGVVLFRREKDYRVLGLKGSDAYFTPTLQNDPEPEPTAVMFGGLSEPNRLVFQHELAHYFMRRAQGHIPVWHPDDGLPFAERALQAEPSCWQCLDTYALLLSEKGRYREAVAAEARALELVPEENRAAPLLERLRKLQAAARAKAAATPPSP